MEWSPPRTSGRKPSARDFSTVLEMSCHVANVFDRGAELLDGTLQPRTAQSRRAHVYAATALAEVHGDADNSNFLSHFVSRSDPCFLASEGARNISARKVREARISPFSSARCVLDAPLWCELPRTKDTRGKSCEGRESPRECARCRKSKQQYVRGLGRSRNAARCHSGADRDTTGTLLQGGYVRAGASPA